MKAIKLIRSQSYEKTAFKKLNDCRWLKIQVLDFPQISRFSWERVNPIFSFPSVSVAVANSVDFCCSYYKAALLIFKVTLMDNGYDTGGTADTSDTRDLGLSSLHRQIIQMQSVHHIKS